MKFSLAFVAVLALTGTVRAGPVIKTPSELNGIFQEFLDLVPVERVSSIVEDYFASDPEVQRVLEYMTSADFKNLVLKVESIEDVIKFYQYLEESGLDIYQAVNYLHEVIGLPPLVPGNPTGLGAAHGGIAGLVADIKAVLPLEDIKALYYKKLATSRAFEHLIQRLSSPTFQKLIDALRANEEFRKIVDFAQAAGLHVSAIVDLLKTLFGLEFSDATLLRTTLTEEVSKDLLDFYKLLPLDEIMDIHKQYAADPGFQEFKRFVHSEEFGQKLQELESIEEVSVFLKFLQESGLDVYRALVIVHNFLELPVFEPTSSLARNTGGIPGFIAEMKAVLRTEEIKALHQEKLQSSPTFFYLSKRLVSPELHYTLTAVRQHPQVRAIVDVFESHGFDFILIVDFFASIAGF